METGTRNLHKIRFITFLISDYSEFKSCGEEFHCSNHLCISKELVCDGVNNCPDSSDELATEPANCRAGTSSRDQLDACQE